MRILLAIDGSAYSKLATEEVANRPFPPDTEIHILSVYEYSPLLMNAENYTELDASVREASEKTINDAVKMLKEKKATLTTAVIYGSPKEVILEEAEKFNADLIVVGSQGKGALTRFLLGSVSQSVALHASCSVEIVRKKEKAS